MVRALKVYRTPIGFHDAYIAAPSQKAALEAWGSDSNLFARGDAELVNDPELTKEPLARPGEVIKRLRGNEEQHLAALPKAQTEKSAVYGDNPPRSKTAAKTMPRPDRKNLELAEDTIAKAETQHRMALRRLSEAEATLARERREMEQAQQSEMEQLQGKRDAAKRAYERAMAKWRG